MWKIIEGYSNYEVNELGQVRNIKTHKILKSYDNKRGYLRVSLSGDDGKQHNVSVHRIVANAFIENDDSEIKTQVNHINEDKYDNRVENLEWVTPSQNIRHGTGIKRRAKSQAYNVVMTYEGLTILFDSAKDVERRTGIPAKSVQKCCVGKLRTTHCAKFAYTDKAKAVSE